MAQMEKLSLWEVIAELFGFPYTGG